MGMWKNIRFAVLMLLLLQLAQYAQTQTSPQDIQNIQNIQELKIKLNTSAVDRLITVKSDFNQPSLLTDYEYGANLAVSWAVPESALTDINSQKVLIFTTIKINEKFPSVYFKDKGKATNTTSTILTCVIANDSCAPESQLNATIPFYVKLEDITTKIRDEDVFLVQASLIPFGVYEGLVNETSSLNKQVDDLKTKLLSLNSTDPEASYLTYRLNAIKEDLSRYNTAGVQEELENITTNIEQLKTQRTINQVYLAVLFIAVILAITVILMRTREIERKVIGIFTVIILALGIAKMYTNLDINIYFILLVVGLMFLAIIAMVLTRRRKFGGGPTYKKTERRQF